MNKLPYVLVLVLIVLLSASGPALATEAGPLTIQPMTIQEAQMAGFSNHIYIATIMLSESTEQASTDEVAEPGQADAHPGPVCNVCEEVMDDEGDISLGVCVSTQTTE